MEFPASHPVGRPGRVIWQSDLREECPRSEILRVGSGRSRSQDADHRR